MNYKKIYDSLIERAKDRKPPAGYIERHHIIPKCMGGSDNFDNLVDLTPEEHYTAHQLLVKIYPEERSLIYAANKMCVGHKGRRNNKRYGWLKRKYSHQRKIDSRGAGNNQYGTIWIKKIDSYESKRIKQDDPIPEGWEKGRVILASRGRSITQGHKDRISEAQRGRKLSDSQRQRISDACKGKKKGIPLSEDHKRKISESLTKADKTEASPKSKSIYVIVVDDKDQQFLSVKDCAKFYGKSSSWVIKMINKGIFKRLSKGTKEQLGIGEPT